MTENIFTGFDLSACDKPPYIFEYVIDDGANEIISTDGLIQFDSIEIPFEPPEHNGGYQKSLEESSKNNSDEDMEQGMENNRCSSKKNKLGNLKSNTRCVVCKKRKIDGVILHFFPKSEPLQTIWAKLCGIKKVKSYMKLCSDHFTKEQYDYQFKAARYLKKHAIPSREMPISINDIPLPLLQNLTSSLTAVEPHETADSILNQIVIARSKSEEVANQLQNICRLCLTESDTSPIDLGNDTVTLAWKLLKIKISVDDTTPTPKTICSDCKQNLEFFSKFKEKCRRNQENLLVLRKSYFEKNDIPSKNNPRTEEFKGKAINKYLNDQNHDYLITEDTKDLVAESNEKAKKSPKELKVEKSIAVTIDPEYEDTNTCLSSSHNLITSYEDSKTPSVELETYLAEQETEPNIEQTSLKLFDCNEYSMVPLSPVILRSNPYKAKPDKVKSITNLKPMNKPGRMSETMRVAAGKRAAIERVKAAKSPLLIHRSTFRGKS